VEVSNEQNRLILDAGTGILGLDFEIYAHLPRIDILLTHLHMDHIQGLAFFKPLFNKDMEVHIWGPGGTSDSLKSHLNRYLSPPLFPLSIRELPCKLQIHEVSNTIFNIGSFEITSAFVIHPGPTVGYRIKEDTKIITYIPDHEPMVGSQELYKNDNWVSGLPLCKNADVLIHDTMYTEEEYQTKIGWGHSSTEHVIQIARRASIKKLYLFHHHPEHSDAFLEQMLQDVKQRNKEAFEILLATQGMEYEL
jgi:ribonuclease BN (tRNA processing enzyme)